VIGGDGHTHGKIGKIFVGKPVGKKPLGRSGVDGWAI
jgi:hypothetical protein